MQFLVDELRRTFVRCSPSRMEASRFYPVVDRLPSLASTVLDRCETAREQAAAVH